MLPLDGSNEVGDQIISLYMSAAVLSHEKRYSKQRLVCVFCKYLVILTSVEGSMTYC